MVTSQYQVPPYIFLVEYPVLLLNLSHYESKMGWEQRIGLSLSALCSSCSLVIQQTTNKTYILKCQDFKYSLLDYLKLQTNDSEMHLKISSRCQLIFVSLCNSVFMMSLLNHCYCTTNRHSLVMVVDSDGGQRTETYLSGSSDCGCQDCLVCHSSCKSPIGL